MIKNNQVAAIISIALQNLITLKVNTGSIIMSNYH